MKKIKIIELLRKNTINSLQNSFKGLTKSFVFVIVVTILSVILFFIPNGFEGARDTSGLPVKALVEKTDNSFVRRIGVINTGDQRLYLKILNGKYKGRKVESNNLFVGKLEFDRLYKPGEKVFAVLEINDDDTIRFANVIDYYRLSSELILFGLFALFLIIFSRWVGVKALLSFIFTALLIWKVLIPSILKGIDPILISFAVTLCLTGVIIILVGGFNRKGLTAFIGSAAGVFLTLILALLFGRLFNISGGLKPFSETLLYSGYTHLNLSKIFLSGIFIASSGAIMDIAMDISASMSEVCEKKPDISFKELVNSGFNVGRLVVGTMTTTLLLAYSAGYSTLLMVFMAQGTPVLNILNLQYVAAEILNTLVGSFGLVAVAPLTAIAGGFVYKYELRIKK